MASMGDVRRALAERIGQVADDFTVYAFIPDAVIAPCLYIDPDRPFLDYQQAFRSGQAYWRFAITILVNRIDDESAQNALDDLVDPFGVIVSRLQADDIDDSMAEIACYAEVLSATRYGSYRVGGTTYFGTQIMIEVRT